MEEGSFVILPCCENVSRVQTPLVSFQRGISSSSACESVTQSESADISMAYFYSIDMCMSRASQTKPVVCGVFVYPRFIIPFFSCSIESS